MLLKHWPIYDSSTLQERIGDVRVVEHEIHTVGPPVRCTYRPLNPLLESKVKLQIDRWLRQKVIQKNSESPRCSPLLIEHNIFIGDKKVFSPLDDMWFNCISSFKPHTCISSSSTFLWEKDKPNCMLFGIRIISGEIISELGDKHAFFVAHDKLLHVNLKQKVTNCNRVMYTTDIEKVFLVDITEYHSNDPIQDILPSVEVSLFAEFAIRDQFIYNVLLRIIKENTKLLALNHCQDLHKMANKLTQVHNILGSSNLEPFALTKGLNKFLIPIADTLILFIILYLHGEYTNTHCKLKW